MDQKLEKLSPSYVEKIWGGKKLAVLRNLDCSGFVGETFEVNRKEIPYLIKYIHATDFLSVQVHPDDDYALKNEKESGKMECWLILDSEHKSGVYLGFKKGVQREDFYREVQAGKPLEKFLEFHEVKRGDFFFVPPGTVHSIGKGILLLEVQQSSGITYRLNDWGRKDSAGNPRELHIEKAMDVLCFGDDFNSLENFKAKRNLFQLEGFNEIIKTAFFTFFILKVLGSQSKKVHVNSFSGKISFMVLSGEGKVQLGCEIYNIASMNSYIIDIRGIDFLEINAKVEIEIVIIV